ncbi:MAG: HPP family protein [Nitrososphaeraceae archaeon]
MVLKEINRKLYESLKDFRNKKIKDLTESPLIISENYSISKMIDILLETNASDIFIPIGKSISSINIRDILPIRDISNNKILPLTKKITSLTNNDTLGQATRIMSLYRLRALPIVDESQKIIAQISAKEIVKFMLKTGLTGSSTLKDIKINAHNIMTPDPITLTSKDEISKARDIMIRRKIDHIPVVDPLDETGSIKGLVTSHDILSILSPSERIGRKSIGIENSGNRMQLLIEGILTNNITISEIDNPLHNVIELLNNTNSTYAIIKSHNKLEGIITYRDIIDLLGEQIEHDVPAYIIGLPDNPLDAEVTKTKFDNLIKLLRKMEPEVEEAKCKIKLSNIQGERKIYEIDINIITPYRRHVYSDSGWDLVNLFDQASDSLKNQIAHRRSERQRESIRYPKD